MNGQALKHNAPLCPQARAADERDASPNHRNRRQEQCLSQLLEQARKEHTEMAARIEQLNVALKAMVENREIEKRAIETLILSNVKKWILPYIERMAICPYNDGCQSQYHIIRQNLDKLLHRSDESYLEILNKLNPNEIKIADLIRQGKATKEIADILNLAPSSISWYRNQIRQKLGLVSAKTSLRSFLNQVFTGKFE